MVRLNLFSELKTMERVLDERTELLVLRKHYRFYHTNPLLMTLCILNFWLAAGGEAPQEASLFLAVIGVMGLLSVLCWPCYQLANGIYCLDIPLAGDRAAPGNLYWAFMLAVECLASGLLTAVIALGFVPRMPLPFGCGLFLLGAGAGYAVLCAAHHTYLHKMEEPGARKAGTLHANGLAAAVWLAAMAGGLACLLAPDALGELRAVPELAPLTAVQFPAWAVYENSSTVHGETRRYTGYDAPLRDGKDSTVLTVEADGTARRVDSLADAWEASTWQAQAFAYRDGVWNSYAALLEQTEDWQTRSALVQERDGIAARAYYQPPSARQADVAWCRVEPQGDETVYTVAYTAHYWAGVDGAPQRESLCTYTLDAAGDLAAFSCDETVNGDARHYEWRITARGAAAVTAQKEALQKLSAQEN